MTTYENLSQIQKLRATIHRDARSICAETCHFLGLEISKAALEVIAELVFKKITVYGTDLECFAKHAKRQTINSEDVKLLVRRNPNLLAHLTELAGSVAPKEKRRKTLPVKQPETPANKQKENEKEKSPVVDKPQEREDVQDDAVIDVNEMIDLTFD